MINRENMAGLIVAKLGQAETPLAVAPTTLDQPGQVPVQGFVAITPNFLVFLQEGGLEGIQIAPYPRSQLEFQGNTFGIAGKTFIFSAGGNVIRFGGLEMAFEQAIEKNFTVVAPPMSAPPPPPPPQQQSYQQPPAPPPQASAPPRYTPGEPSYAPASGSRGPVLAVAILMGIVVLLAVVGYLFLSSMRSRKSEVIQQETSAIPASIPAPAESSGAGNVDSIIVTSSTGDEVINIRRKESGKYAVTVDGTTYKGKFKDDKIKINTIGDKTLIKVKNKEDGFKITDGSDKLLFKVKVSGTGYKVGTETATLARIKPKGSGWAVTSDDDRDMGSVEPDGADWKVLDASGNLLYTVKGASGKGAAVLLALSDNQMVGAGVLLYLNEF